MLHTFKRGGLAAVVTALLFFVYVPTASAAAPPAQGVVVSQAAQFQTAVPNCCAGAWYPWGWYSSRAKCDAAGEHVLDTVPVALLYKCNYHSKGPKSAPSKHYQLYVFEAG